jgi:hypothetical protein
MGKARKYCLLYISAGKARRRWASVSALSNKRKTARRGTTWILDQLDAERSRWMLWLPVAMGLGIAVYFELPSEPALWLGPALAADL